MTDLRRGEGRSPYVMLAGPISGKVAVCRLYRPGSRTTDLAIVNDKNGCLCGRAESQGAYRHAESGQKAHRLQINTEQKDTLSQTPV